MGNACDNTHEVGDSEVDYMGEAWQAMLEDIERVDMAGSESRFNVVAHGVVVTSVVSSYTKKLVKLSGN